METKHTPGPWNLDKRQEKLMGANGQSIVVWNSGLSFGNRTEEAEANARLIAAAPELLDALKAIRDGWEHNLSEAMAQANVAIAKAEGR